MREEVDWGQFTASMSGRVTCSPLQLVQLCANKTFVVQWFTEKHPLFPKDNTPALFIVCELDDAEPRTEKLEGFQVIAGC